MPLFPNVFPPIPAGSLSLSTLQNIQGYRTLGNNVGGDNPPGALDPTQLMSQLFARGADLGDASVTIQPFTDNARLYVMPAAMTANRTITLGNTGAPLIAGIYHAVFIWRRVSDAFTLTIKDAGGVNIYVDPANPGVDRILWFATNPNSGQWAAGHYCLKMRNFA